jgi:hypothetical protein
MGRRFLIIAALLLAALPATAQVRGDWVLARWQGGSYWFPGVVEKSSPRAITVAYDDGTRETLPPGLVRPYDWDVGTRIECRWQNGNEWYSGYITAMSGDGVTLNISYDDGDREQTRTAACRSL